MAAVMVVALASGGGSAAAAGVAGSQFASQNPLSSAHGVEFENTGTGPMVRPTIPITPSVPTEQGKFVCRRSGGRRGGYRRPEGARGCSR